MPLWLPSIADASPRSLGRALACSGENGCVQMETVTLFRPIGPKELRLIEESGFSAFPPRLPEQPIFYPVTTEDYAVKIARDWNVKESGEGFVTRFRVRCDFLDRYQIQDAGGSQHQEYWIPAEALDAFNANIVGKIEVIASFGNG